VKEIKEAVELPLTHPELYEDIGIRPPKGVILYGCPGTGKTLLAKAVAHSTSATFLRVVGSELIQKYLGDGPKLVRELFRVADENAPSIVFIDEIDAIGTKRYDASSGGEREIQRTLLELLNQLDGFDSMTEVKVCCSARTHYRVLVCLFGLHPRNLSSRLLTLLCERSSLASRSVYCGPAIAWSSACCVLSLGQGAGVFVV
jgi:ATP-dependent 26S proteasome regulatory subunit